MASKSVVIVTGEASGDQHAAHVARALRRRRDDLFICGVGGPALKAAGVKVLIEASELAVVGITEVFGKAARLLKAMGRLKRLLSGLRPELLILVDFPDFNLHLAAAARKLGIPVLYYISPQVWAWRSGRVRKIKERVDHMAVILPFEKDFYEKHGVPVTFVGHPLMDAAASHAVAAAPAPPSGSRTIGLLPGSRDSEVARLLPVMLEAARLLNQRGSELDFVISCAPSIDPASIAAEVKRRPLPNLSISNEPVENLFPRCRLVITASGTVTLEAAICTTPMIITYIVSPISYSLGRMLIRVPFIGLVNLIAGRRVVAELVQYEVTPAAVAEEAWRLWSDPAAHARMCSELRSVRERLGQPGASEQVADLACALLDAAHAV